MDEKFTSLVKEGVDKLVSALQLKNGMTDEEKTIYIANCLTLRLRRIS